MTIVQIDLIKGWTFKWPRLENKEFIMTIGSGRPMENAARHRLSRADPLDAADYGFDELDTYMQLTQCDACVSAIW